MFKLLRSNLREIIALLLLIPLMLAGLHLLGSAEVSQNGPLSTLVSLAVSVLGGVLKFAVVLILAWVGLAVTFPEAGRFTHSDSFDTWWGLTPAKYRGYVSICFAAVLILAAAICMAS